MFWFLALLANVVVGDQLTLGYPTKVKLVKNVPCVIDVTPSFGATLLRVLVDVSDLQLLGSPNVVVNMGPYRRGQPMSQAGGGATFKTSKGDVLMTVDRPTIAGVPEKWWIAITSDQDEDALVTAVAYDIAERPRVNIQFGKRSGNIMVEEGQLEVFSQLVPAQPTTKVVINIDTAKFLSFADTYKVYVNKITLSSIAQFLANASFKDFAQLLASINKAIRTGNVSNLPAIVTPDATKADLTLDPSTWTGKVEFDLPDNEDTLLVISIAGQKTLPAWTGTLTGYNVKFSLGADDGNDNYEAGQCSAINRRRDVAAAGSACDNKPCSDCVADANCSYCLSAIAGESKCRPKDAQCSATTGAGVKAASVDQCRACNKITDPTACNANTANHCTFCNAVSAGTASLACIDRFLCDELTAPTSAASTSSSSGAATSNNANPTTAPSGQFFTNDAVAMRGVALFVAVASVFASLLI